jgi:hypothetical protein
MRLRIFHQENTYSYLLGFLDTRRGIYSGGGDNENSAEEVRLFYPSVKICATRILTAMRMLD